MLPRFATSLLYIVLVLILYGHHPHAKAELGDRFEFSGFARIVAGLTTDSEQSYNGYNGNLSIKPDSLLGLRANGTLTDSLQIVGQAILRADATQGSQIQWLYADYRPNDTLSFKLGRQRIPMFQYSEVIDVGFSYPWITIPLEIYNPFVFTEYDGLLASYEYSSRYVFGNFDAYFGEYNGDIFFGDNTIPSKVSDLAGFTATAQVSQFSFRASYHSANVTVSIDDLVPFQQILNQFGFVESASALDVDDKVEYFQFSAGWENIDYFARFEFTQFDSPAFFVAKADNYYVTVGYNLYPYTFHLTYANSTKTYSAAPNEIPVGFDPQLDFLAQQFTQATLLKPLNDMESAKIGVRYDWRANIALKFDITFLADTEDEGVSNLISSPFSVGEETELVQAALEWVF